MAMSVEAWIKVWRGGFAVSFFGATQFVICCLIAMALYPGGNVGNRAASGYWPQSNFVSDLGRTDSLSGKPNRTGSRVFNISLIVFAISLAPFFLFMPMQAWDRSGLLATAAVLGGLASVGLLVEATHPADLYPAMHHLGLFGWVFGLFLSTSLHGYSLLTSRENRSLFMPLISVAVAMLAIGFCISAGETAYAFLFFKPDVPLQSVVLEKLVFLGALIWLFSFSLRMMLTADFSEYQMKQRDIDAEEYLGQIGIRRSAD
jgi:hypothetical protein